MTLPITFYSALSKNWDLKIETIYGGSLIGNKRFNLVTQIEPSIHKSYPFQLF